jgi:hypothetical protein
MEKIKSQISFLIQILYLNKSFSFKMNSIKFDT